MKNSKLSSRKWRFYLAPNSESPDLVIAAPVVESFLYCNCNNSFWSNEFSSNPIRLAEANFRKELSDDLSWLFNFLSKRRLEINIAIDQGFIGVEKISRIYDRLSDFLEADIYNDRLILYLPFSLLVPRDWCSADASLNKSLERFFHAYQNCWHRLLSVHDVRENFVRGDVLDSLTEKTSLPRVCKVAHFVPVLVSKGWVSINEVLSIINTTEDEVLIDSLLDSFPSLIELGFLSAQDLIATTDIKSSLSIKLFQIARSYIEKKGGNNKNGNKESLNWQQLLDWPMMITQDFEAVRVRYFSDLEQIVSARAKWLQVARKDEIVEKWAQRLSGLLLKYSTSLSSLRDLLEVQSDINFWLIIIRGVGLAVEGSSGSSPQVSQAIRLSFHSMFYRLWISGPEEIKEQLESLWCRWFSAGIINADFFGDLGIVWPKFNIPFFERQLGADGYSDFTKLADSVLSHPGLSQYLLPVVILYGSRVKGYGSKSADLDIAVFIRPEVDITDRSKIHKAWRELLSSLEYDIRPLEFWLTGTERGLSIRNFSNSQKSLGHSNLVHVLLGGVYYGREGVIKQLYQLSVGYLSPSNLNLRGRWLEEVERDFLQYRLMHKGYSRFFAPRLSDIPNSDEINSDSTFWDQGFRELATGIFLRQVFLPHLK